MRLGEGLLAAALHFFRRIPGRVATADAIGMSDPDRTRRAARPVVAGVIRVIAESATIGRRAGQNVMDIAVLGLAPDHLTLFVQDRQLPQTIMLLRRFQRVAMQFILIGGNDAALRVVPGTGANTVARIDRRLTGARLGAEIGMPGFGRTGGG